MFGGLIIRGNYDYPIHLHRSTFQGVPKLIKSCIQFGEYVVTEAH